MLNISCVLLFPHGADLLRSVQEVIRSSVPPNIKCGSVSRSWKQHRSFGNVFIQHLHPHATHKGVGIQPASTHTRVPDAMRFTPHIHCHTLPFHTTRCWGMWNAWKTRQTFWCRAFLCTKAGLKGLRKDLECLDWTRDSLDCMEAQLCIEVENETGNYEIHFKWRKSQK